MRAEAGLLADGGKFRVERAAQRNSGSSPREQRWGQGRQQVRAGWAQRCTSEVPVVAIYTRLRAGMPYSLIYTLGLTQQSWEKILNQLCREVGPSAAAGQLAAQRLAERPPVMSL